jgi:uncharacterized membrane protein YphA (DoxX/SURF4 family)
MRHLNTFALLGLALLLGWAWMRGGWLKFGEDKDEIEDLLKRRHTQGSAETRQDSASPDSEER